MTEIELTKQELIYLMKLVLNQFEDDKPVEYNQQLGSIIDKLVLIFKSEGYTLKRKY